MQTNEEAHAAGELPIVAEVGGGDERHFRAQIGREARIEEGTKQPAQAKAKLQPLQIGINAERDGEAPAKLESAARRELKIVTVGSERALLDDAARGRERERKRRRARRCRKQQQNQRSSEIHRYSTWSRPMVCRAKPSPLMVA